MLLLYTGYMTWWASGISHEVHTNNEQIQAHIIADELLTREQIRLTQLVKDMQTDQEKHSDVITETIAQHAKCTAIMDAVLKRLEKLENEPSNGNGRYRWQ